MNEENIFFPIVLGISSSLVATAIFISISEIVRRLIIPWVEDKIYRGVRIDGEWKLSFVGVEDSNIVSSFNIKQWGDKISGTYFHEMDDEKTSYTVHGTLKNMYLMAYMEPKSSKTIDACSILMHVEHHDGLLTLKGGLLMKGKTDAVEGHIGVTYQQKK